MLLAEYYVRLSWTALKRGQPHLHCVGQNCDGVLVIRRARSILSLYGRDIHIHTVFKVWQGGDPDGADDVLFRYDTANTCVIANKRKMLHRPAANQSCYLRQDGSLIMFNEYWVVRRYQELQQGYTSSISNLLLLRIAQVKSKSSRKK